MNTKLLNWLIDDGISVKMLSDQKRNQFYDLGLKELVSNKKCIDVGFGTGLLSFLALKHGAESIRAYESNFKRFELGLHILKETGVESQIQLINKSFDTSCILPTDDIIFHEIIGALLYNENLQCTFNDRIPVFPAMYRTDFLLFEVDAKDVDSLKIAQPEEQVRTRIQKEFFLLKENPFSVGIEVNEKYSNIIRKFANEFFNDQLTTQIHKMDPKTVSDFNLAQKTLFESFKKENSKLACSIVVDYKEKQKYVETVISKELLKNRTVVVVPNYYFSNNDRTFELSSGHWNSTLPWQESVVLDCVENDVHVRQDLLNGRINYWE